MPNVSRRGWHTAGALDVFAQLPKVLKNSHKTDRTMVRPFKNEDGPTARSHIVIPFLMKGFQQAEKHVAGSPALLC